MKTKITIKREQVVKLLAPLNMAIVGKPIMPILGNYLIRYSPESTSVTASNLQCYMTVGIPSDTKDTGEICVNAELFFQTLSMLPNGDVDITFDDETFGVCIYAERQDGGFKNGTYESAGERALDFPKDADNTHELFLELPCSDLYAAFASTVKFTSHDNMRPSMQGVCIDDTTELKFVATDGHAICVHTYNGSASGDSSQYIIQGENVSRIMALLALDLNADCQIYLSDKYARFELNNYVYTCRLIDEKYPNYNAVLEANNIEPKATCVVNTTLFRKAIKRLSSFSSHGGLTASFGTEAIAISAHDLQLNGLQTASENIPCETTGKLITMNLSIAELDRVLAQVKSESIALNLHAAEKPICITDNNNFYLVMPRAAY